MEVCKSKTIGYCHGVASTLEKAQYCIDTAKSRNKNAYSIGKLIHNQDVVKAFEEQGLKVISDSAHSSGIALVRAHGIADSVKDDFEKHGFELVDATCVNILYTKKVIRQESAQGRKIVLLGVKGHAETECLMGTQGVDCFLVSSREDLERLFESVCPNQKITLVTQTTFPQSLYKELSGKIAEHYKDCEIGNRLCPDCIKRKKDGMELAEKVDAVIVVGGKNSENTKDLALFIADSGKPVITLENVRDFNADIDEALKRYSKVGVCSGTSTPIEIIEGVCKHLADL